MESAYAQSYSNGSLYPFSVYFFFFTLSWGGGFIGFFQKVLTILKIFMQHIYIIWYIIW